MTEQKIVPENPFLKEEGIETAASTNLVTAGGWLNNNETPLKLFDKLTERYGKGKRQNVHSEIACEVIAVSSWRAQNRPELVVQAQENLLRTFERAKELGFQQEIAVSIASIAETNGQPVEKVVDLVKKIVENSGFASMEWSTAASMVSAMYAENMTYEAVREVYKTISETVKADETTHCALMHAALQSTSEKVLSRYQELAEIKIDPSPFVKKERVTKGSKAFLVLAEVIGKLNPEQTVNLMRILIKEKKLEQATATRLLLAEANKTAEKPVLNRQGTYKDGERIIEDVSFRQDLGIYDGIPMDGKFDGQGLNMVIDNSSTPNIISFALPLRLGNNRY